MALMVPMVVMVVMVVISPSIGMMPLNLVCLFFVIQDICSMEEGAGIFFVIEATDGMGLRALLTVARTKIDGTMGVLCALVLKGSLNIGINHQMLKLKLYKKMEIIKPLVHAERILSNRQLEVFILMGSGKTVGDIEKLLFISKKTVWSHKFRIMEKMGFKNTFELLYYAIKHKLNDEERSDE